MKKNKSKRTYQELHEEWMADPKYVKEWNQLGPEFQLKEQAIKARLRTNLSQTDLAKKMGTGQAAISRVENGNASPTLAWIQRLAKALDTPITLVIK